MTKSTTTKTALRALKQAACEVKSPPSRIVEVLEEAIAYRDNLDPSPRRNLLTQAIDALQSRLDTTPAKRFQ